MALDSAEGAGPHEGPPQAVSVEADIAASFTYASYQNAIPVIRSISICNRSQESLERCTLELTATPPFLRAKTWTIDRILPGDSLALSDRKVELDAGYLAGLNEAERGEITLRLACGGAVRAEQRIPVRLLARDEWGGVADMAQLLPAFVMPNDPAIASILRGSGDQLTAHGHSSALDGYQSGNPQRAFMLAAAVYSAVAGMSLYYAEPPSSFESNGQKIRRPATIESERLATCLDTTLLFAAALEAAGLHPVILMFHGHSAVGVWLTQKTFSSTIETDAMEVRKALASHELLVFETTGVTHRPPMTLEAAQRAIDHRLDEAEAADFVAAIDVRRARSGGITPLASHEPMRGATPPEDTGDATALPLPAAPAIDDLPAGMAEARPTTAAGRIDRWQKKLLDLTLRNRLLNFASTRKTIPFLCTDVGHLEDRLNKGAAIRLISLPEQNPLGERDAALYREVHGRDLQRNFAAEALSRDELPSTLEAADLTNRLIELFRQVRNDLAEGGTNTLFLAVGFLRWRKKPGDERSYRAPLLLVPVKLERRSASSQFSLRFHEDEPRFNATLLQFLERDFDLRLPQFSGELPLDDNGVDVPLLLATMRQAVRDVPGMEVLDETALSTFSFAKFLMWKDLVERTDALRQNRVVRHLIDTPEQAFQNAADGAAFHDERELDRRYQPRDIVSLLPSDSSQIAASIAAAEGHDFVIVGPPGTGKSQTIANMIANCLAAGKSVLFVAEKTAALDVVYRRLREHGLGDHCLELHSNKADRRHFLSQLKASWESRGRFEESEWIGVNERLRLRRDELNAYVEALHRRYGNGLTPYGAMGVTLKYRRKHAPALSWPSHDAHDETARQSLDTLAGEIGRTFASVEMRPALRMVDIAEWTTGWQDDLLAAAQALRGAIDAAGKAIGAFLAGLGLQPREDASQTETDALCRLAKALKDSAGRDVTVAFDPDLAALRQALSALESTIKEHDAARERLSASYDFAALSRLDLDATEREWHEAAASFWPSSALKKRKLRKLMQGYATRGVADPDKDIASLRAIMECRIAADANPLAAKPVAFAGLDTDVVRLGETLKLAENLRAALRLPDRDAEESKAVLRVVAPLLCGEIDAIARPSASRLLAATDALQTAVRRFSELAGKAVSMADGGGRLARLDASLGELLESRHLLRDWSTWCRIRKNAVDRNLGPLVEDIETGLVPAEEAQLAFRLAYSRWWLQPTLDNDPVLRDFRRFQHENAIADFREIDDLVRAQATHRVAGAIAHDLPSVQGVPRKSELGLLRHQMELQRPSRSIREMIGAMPEAFPKLAPCMLMSPLSIAQYLPPDQALFDVVIFDEASQITTWDAVGAIARARQTIIVGDPKQLPPTNFFGRNEDDDEVIEDYERDLESILDETKAAGIPVRDLRWHYRSRSESLIAFSNYHYYQNRLVTFPSPAVDDQAVRLRKITNGIYDRGKSRTNRIEAEAVAAEAVARMRAWLKLEERDRPTLGVITFNAQQQSLILDLLDRARSDEPELEWFFADERVEPTIVKNLENVQGDERDVILFSTTFSEDAAGRRTMDFGALNREGGERRLNVAVTRARQELIVFSGFTADLIDTGRTKATGVHHLKAFLDYAERGKAALPAQDKGSAGALESPFEEAVAAELEKRGWIVVPQVGISAFRVDIGIRHPDFAGAFLAGIECDGATYHSSATARDRDKVREQVLRGLGWEIIRVWSTDWWFDPEGSAERLHASLDASLKKSRDRRAEQAAAGDVTGAWDMGHEIDPVAAAPAETAAGSAEPAQPETDTEADSELVTLAERTDPAATEMGRMAIAARAVDEARPESTDAQPAENLYRVTDLSGFEPNPERFYDFEYRGTLRAMIDAVLDREGPLRVDILAQRIARAHGWLRTGVRIRERIDLHLRDAEKTTESSGDFVWKKGSVNELMDYRPPYDLESRRGIADIPLAELAAMVVANKHLLDQHDPALELARLLGVERLAAASRARLDEAIGRARASLEKVPAAGA